MKKNNIALLLSLVLLSQFVFGQDKHITYLGDVFAVSISQDTKGNRKSNYEKRKGYYNILVYKDKKAISYRFDTIQSENKRMLLKNSYSTTLFNNKNNKTRHFGFYYIEKRDKFNFDGFTTNWQNNRPDLKPDFTIKSNALKLVYDAAGIDTTFKAPIINYTEKNKTIKGYHCKNAIVNSYDKEYTVWYTEEIDYHWCFDDFCALIHGTPILIEYKNEPYLEFVSIKDLDYDKIWVKKKVIDFVLENWNKKIKPD